MMQKICKTSANRRKNVQTGANRKNVTSLFFQFCKEHDTLGLVIDVFRCLLLDLVQTMSAERLSSCNSLVGGCAMVLDRNSNNEEVKSQTQKAREEIAAKIEASLIKRSC